MLNRQRIHYRLPLRIYLLVILLLPVFILCAQSYSSNDSIRIYQLLDKADDEAVTATFEKAIATARQALVVSKEKKMLRGEAFSKLKVADILVQQESEDKEIEEFFSDGWRIGTHLKDSFILALTSYQQGQYYMYNGRLVEAEALFNKSLELKFEKEQSLYTASVYNDLGYMFGSKDDWEKEAFWYLRAIRVSEKVEDLAGLSTTTNNLATVYHKLGDNEKAIYYGKEAVEMREKLGNIRNLANSCENLSRYYWTVSLDSASKYQQMAMGYAEKTGIKSLIMRSYDNLSTLMDKRRNKPEALAYIQKSIALCRETDDKGGLARRCSWAAILSADIKDTVGMEKYFQEAYSLIQPLNNKTLLRDYFGSRVSVYKKMKDYQHALESLEKYQLYKDSLSKEQTATNVAELQTKYETEKKDNEISRLNTQQRIRQLEIDKQKAVIAGNKLEAQQKETEIRLLSQQQEIRDGRIKQQSEELEKQLLLARNSQQQLQLAEKEQLLTDKQLQTQTLTRNVLIGAVLLSCILAWVLFNRYQLKKKIQQQNELLSVRNHIAKDLHDEIGSTLTSIKILSQVSQSNLEKDQRKASSMLEKITEQSAQMQQGMSDIVWAIKPDNDKFENMLVRMREFTAHTLEPKNIETVFLVEETVLTQSLDMQQRKDFFLIFKEAINNAAKYSNASKVEVAVTREKDQLMLRISDNGIGFMAKTETSSNGLKNMKARAASLRGSVDILSQPGQGTVVLAKLPAT